MNCFWREAEPKTKFGVERKRWMRKISTGHNAFTIFPRVNPFVNWFGNENAPKLCLSLAYIPPVYLHNLLSFLSFPEIGAQTRSILWLVLKYCRGPLLYIFCLHIFIKHFPRNHRRGINLNPTSEMKKKRDFLWLKLSILVWCLYWCELTWLLLYLITLVSRIIKLAVLSASTTKGRVVLGALNLII